VRKEILKIECDDHLGVSRLNNRPFDGQSEDGEN